MKTGAMTGIILRLALRTLVAAPLVVLLVGCDPGYSLTYRVCDLWPNAGMLDVQSELKRGADVNAMLEITDEYRATPLHIAATCNADPEVASLPIEHGADVHAEDSWGNTPLYGATKNWPRSHRFIALLLEYGADPTAEAHEEICHDRPDACEIVSTTILYSAARNSDAAAIKLLLEHGADADINTIGLYGDTPLQARANVIWPIGSEEHTEPIRLLLEYGADINTETEIGRTPLHLMAEEASPALIQLMLIHGADVNAKAPGWGTPLHEAAYNPNPAVTRMLLENGADADINAVGYSRNTPLHKAVKGGRYPHQALRLS